MFFACCLGREALKWFCLFLCQEAQHKKFHLLNHGKNNNRNNLTITHSTLGTTYPVLALCECLCCSFIISSLHDDCPYHWQHCLTCINLITHNLSDHCVKMIFFCYFLTYLLANIRYILIYPQGSATVLHFTWQKRWSDLNAVAFPTKSKLLPNSAKKEIRLNESHPWLAKMAFQ